MLRIRVSTASAEITETELITTGRRGLECAFEFNSAWDGLAKTVIVNGVVKRDIVLVSDTITVPGECLAKEQFPLRIGVYGANGAGEIVIPTIWANFGKILPSARPSGVDPDEVTPDVVAQIQTNSSDALRLAQEVLRRADSGEFDGRDGATGPAGRDGRDGIDGQYGAKGEKGDPGVDGFSPEVSVTAITGGHRVTIVDAQGTENFNVMDGEKGDPFEYEDFTEAQLAALTGPQGPTGPAGPQGDPGVYVGSTEPTDPSVRVWVDTDGDADETDVFWATYNTTTETEITSAVTAGKAVLCKISDEVFYLTKKASIGPSGTAWMFVSANSNGTQANLRFTWISGSYWNTIGTQPIPTKTSDLANDSGFLTSFTETDPTVPAWAKESSKPTYTASEVGALPDNTAIPTKTSDLANDSGFLTQHQDISGKLDKAQGVAHAGEFCVVGSDGNITTVAVPSASGVSF